MDATVADARGRRLDAATGIVAAVLLLAGFAIQTKPPSPDDPAAKIAAYLADNRDAILTGDFIIAIGSAFFLWFLGSLRSYLRAGEGGEGRLSATAFLGGGVATSLVLAGAGVQSAVVLHTETLADRSLVVLGFDAYNALITIGGAALAVAIGAASCSAARSGALPSWAYWSGTVVTVFQVLSLIGLFATSGFFAAGQTMALVAFFAAGAWYIAVAVLMIRRGGVPPVARTAP